MSRIVTTWASGSSRAIRSAGCGFSVRWRQIELQSSLKKLAVVASGDGGVRFTGAGHVNKRETARAADRFIDWQFNLEDFAKARKCRRKSLLVRVVGEVTDVYYGCAHYCRPDSKVRYRPVFNDNVSAIFASAAPEADARVMIPCSRMKKLRAEPLAVEPAPIVGRCGD
nr:hypothetical protein [uncultured Rhodopila sp.]